MYESQAAAHGLQAATQQPNVVDEEVFKAVMARFIELANEMQSGYAPQLIATAMNYATSRYSTYVVAQSVTNASELNDARANAETFFFEQYQTMFKENFDDHVARYDAYMKS